jgi:NRAMP (natural resistance-associated macrophage protein)-like metal ion transporter
MAKKVIERIAEAPAQALDKTIDTTKKVAQRVVNQKPIKKTEEFWHTLGPGLTTGAADDDPSGIATYSQTGAKYGFQLLWLAGFTFPLMALVQEMCARIGLVTGQGLAANIRHHFPKWVLYFCTGLLFIANTFNLGADLGAMAKGTQLLVLKVSFSLLVIGFAVLSLFLQIFTTYEKYAKYLKWLALVLLSYVFSALSIHLNWHEIVKHAIIPSITFSKEQIFLITGVLGTTISPYLFFWQTSQEVEEEILGGKTQVSKRNGAGKQQIKKMRIDVWSGMFLSNVVMFFIIAACAATLFAHGITNIQTAADAALALRPLAGEGAYLLFALGIIGTGLLAVPVLAGSASYALSESFEWEEGLYKKLKDAYSFYGVIIISTAIGLLLNFTHLDPIKALIYSAVANGLVAPVVLILILILSSNKNIMGEWANNRLTSGLGWLITGIMTLAGAATIISLFL